MLTYQTLYFLGPKKTHILYSRRFVGFLNFYVGFEQIQSLFHKAGQIEEHIYLLYM